MRRGPWLPAIALSLALARCPSAHGQIDLFFIEAAAAGKAPAATDAAGAENAAREDGDLLAAARTRLELASGDVLAGELADCPAAGKIAWQADGFASSFLFPTAAVGAVQFPLDAEVKQPTGEFRVELVAGDVLFGAVQELTADMLRLDTPEFGVLEIARSEIRQLERWGAVDQVNYFGPNGMAGWTALDGLKGWRAAGGRLEATGPGVIELTACRIPQRAMIELELAWGERPEFSIQVVSDDQAVKNFAALVPRLLNGRRDEAPPRPPVALELTAIGGQLILLTEGVDAADVALVDDLHGGARRLQLILYVDPKTQTASAYGYSGRKIADLKVPSDVFGKSLGMLRIANRSGELRVNRLVVRDWSGELPTEAAGDATYVQDKHGKTFAAGGLTIEAEEKDDGALVATSPDLDDPVPLAEVARITLPASEKKQTDAATTHTRMRMVHMALI